MTARRKASPDRSVAEVGGAQSGPNGQVVEGVIADAVSAGAGGPHAAANKRASAGDYQGAAELYRVAAAADPADIPALLGLGAALLGLGQYEAAEREIRRALRVAPEEPAVHLQLGVALFKRAVYAAAAASLRRTVELDPACIKAYLLLGESHNQLNEPDDAIAALEQVVRAESNPRAYYALGIAYDRKGQPERAAEMYRRSRELTSR
jgi:tetratricopeptide (TPR) repeat protein